MDYLDTSVLVSALTNEAGSERVQRWLAAQVGGLCISHWVVAEFSAALSRKLRMRTIGQADRARALTVFARRAERSFTTLTVSVADFLAAARFSDQHALGLRASDALHLAIASTHGARLVTLDVRLAEAGPPLGVSTHLLEQPS